MNPQLLASSSETPLDGGTPRALPKQDLGSASLGVRPLAPLHRLTDRVSTPPDLTRPEGLAEAWPQAKRRSVLPKQLAEASCRNMPAWDRPKPVPGASGANRLPRSALVVSHHLDGLLHSAGCRPIASCYRSWGSPAFLSGRLHVPIDHRSDRPRPGHAPAALAARFVPYKEFPSPVAVPHHCGRCLLAVHTPRGDDASCDTRCRAPQPASPRDMLDFKALLH